MGKYYDNNKLDKLAEKHTEWSIETKAKEYQKIKRAYRSGFIEAVKLMSSNGEIADVGGSL